MKPSLGCVEEVFVKPHVGRQGNCGTRKAPWALSSARNCLQTEKFYLQSDQLTMLPERELGGGGLLTRES